MKQAEKDVLEAHVETQKQRIAELQEELAQARAQEQILNARIEQLEKQAQGAAWCGVKPSDAAWQAYLDASQETAPKLPPSIDEVRWAFEKELDPEAVEKMRIDLVTYRTVESAWFWYAAAARRFGGVK